jgi:peptidoglycan/LPS O-acetylase OafA/YrhL
MKQLPALTGLRGLAAYSVLIAHDISFSISEQSTLILGLSYFGMSLFFVLSGFVIHYNYGAEFARDGVARAARRFLLARFARLYPLYIIGLVVSLSYIPESAFFENRWIALACLTLTQSWFNVQAATGDILANSWSISTEVAFYLLFIPTAATITRLRRPVTWLLVLCVAAPIAIEAATHFMPPDRPAIAGVGSARSYWMFYFSPFVRVFEFFAGVLAAQVFVAFPSSEAEDRAPALVLAGCIAWCLLAIIMGPHSTIPMVRHLMMNFIFAPAIAIGLIVICRHDTVWSRLVSSRLMLAAGEISYSVYLLQFFVLVGLANSFGVRFGGSFVQIGARSLYGLLITTALGYGVYYLFEAPIRGWIRQLAHRPRSGFRGAVDQPHERLLHE